MDSTTTPTWIRWPALAKGTIPGLAALTTFALALLVWSQTRNMEDFDLSRRLQNSPPASVLSDQEPKSIFPFTDRDAVGIYLATTGLLIAAGGGIGGGGFLVPIYILILGFAPKHAIPLSNITVFGGAVANTLLNIKKRHPQADRPLIDWDIIVLMEPLTVAGAIVGANLNKLLPEVILVVLLDFLLLVTAYKTLHDAHHLYELEDIELNKALNRPEAFAEVDKSYTKATGDIAETGAATPFASTQEKLQNGEDRCIVKHYGAISSQNGGGYVVLEQGDDGEDSTALLDKILAQERHAPSWNVTVILAMFSIILIVNVLKGGGYFPSPLGIKCGSIPFWMAQLFILFCTIFVSVVARSHVLQKAKRRERANYAYLPCDIHWNERTTIIFPLLSAFSGLIAGMFGLGGGIVKGPLMLALGVHPAVTSATAACMILFTSFTATSAFVVFGLLIPDYAVLLAIVGFSATVVGQLIMNYLLKKFRRNSFIAFSIGIVVALSAASMTIESVYKILKDGPHAPCGICNALFPGM
jgi:uncharacterized membrane protein YfcA